LRIGAGFSALLAAHSLIGAAHGDWALDDPSLHHAGATSIVLEVAVAFGLAGIAVLMLDAATPRRPWRPSTRAELGSRAASAFFGLLAFDLALLAITLDLIGAAAALLAAIGAWRLMRQQQRRDVELARRSRRARTAVTGLGTENSAERVRRWLAPDQRSAVDMAVKLMVELRVALVETVGAYCGAYVVGDRDRDRTAWDSLERLVECWPAIEELDLDQLYGEDFLTTDELRLLGALEDSIVLMSSYDGSRQAMRLPPAEILRRLRVVVGQGGYEQDWDAILDDIVERTRAIAGDTIGQASIDVILIEQPAAGEPGRWWSANRLRLSTVRGMVTWPRSAHQNRVAAAKKLLDAVQEPLEATHAFHFELAPDGRPLKNAQHATARKAIENGAVCLLALEVDHDLFTETEDDLLQPGISAWRLVQRSLIMAMSTDPARRALATTRSDLIGALRKRQLQLPRPKPRRRRLSLARIAHRIGGP
jgi:hypothetical protein